MEDNKKNGLDEQNDKKGMDLSEQLDKLFSSLNLSRKKADTLDSLIEPDETPLEHNDISSDSDDENIIPEDVVNEEALTIDDNLDDIWLESEDQEDTLDIDMIVPSPDDELSGLFTTTELDATELADFSNEEKIEENNYDQIIKEEVDVESIKNTLDDMSLETEHVSIDENNISSIVHDLPLDFKDDLSLEIDDLNVEKKEGMDSILENDDASSLDNSIDSMSSTPMDSDLEDNSDIDLKAELHGEEIDLSDTYPLPSDLMVDNSQDFLTNDISLETSKFDNLLDDDIKKEIDVLKKKGYKAQGFVYNEGVNSQTVPKVEKEIETSEDGVINYDKVVGENQLMNIESIYNCSDLIKQMSETVFMIELYSRTLPENLPIDVKRESVLNIIKASSIEIDDLLSDAYQRIDVLNEVLEDVAQKAEELDNENKTEIEILEAKIENLKQKIDNRTQYRKSQNAMIGYEIQRIVNIVEFIEPE